MEDYIIIEPFSDEWKREFTLKANKIREALGELALRIDHIGSTSVQGLAAKPVVDILISVESFDKFDTIKDKMESIGYHWQEDNPEKTKRFFRESPPEKRTHIHIRINGHISQQFPLLFRDYLREHEDACKEYETLKYDLAQRFYNQRSAYTEGKSDLIWDIMRRAFLWANETGWIVSNSDA